MSLTEAGLLREVAQVQRDKTLLDVRDAIDSVATTKQGGRNNWETLDRTAKEFRADLLTKLRALLEQS